MIVGIHHVGVAVRDADAAAERYRTTLGATVDHAADVPEQGVRAIALRLPEGPLVELLEPTGDDTPVGRFLARRGEGMHHVAYRAEDIRVELARLTAAGVELIDATPRAGLFGLQVAFIHPDSLFGVLAELVEPNGARHG